jgi:hypothetical protein
VYAYNFLTGRTWTGSRFDGELSEAKEIGESEAAALEYTYLNTVISRPAPSGRMFLIHAVLPKPKLETNDDDMMDDS